MHISLFSLLFSLETNCSFPFVAKIFIQKDKIENFSYHFSSHFYEFPSHHTMNLKDKLSKQDQHKIYINLPKKALEH